MLVFLNSSGSASNVRRIRSLEKALPSSISRSKLRRQTAKAFIATVMTATARWMTAVDGIGTESIPEGGDSGRCFRVSVGNMNLHNMHRQNRKSSIRRRADQITKLS